MCPPKAPKLRQPAPIPDPAPPLEETATEVVRDLGDEDQEGRQKTRVSASDLRVNLNIPGLASGGGNGLNV